MTEPALPAEASTIVDKYRRPGIVPGGPLYQSGVWREPFAASPFEPLRLESFDHMHSTDREGMIAWTLSQSIFASLREEHRSMMADDLLNAIPEAVYCTSMLIEVWWTRLA